MIKLVQITDFFKLLQNSNNHLNYHMHPESSERESYFNSCLDLVLGCLECIPFIYIAV